MKLYNEFKEFVYTTVSVSSSPTTTGPMDVFSSKQSKIIRMSLRKREKADKGEK